MTQKTGRPEGGYRNSAGERVPGVTSVFPRQEALMYWANRLALGPALQARSMMLAVTDLHPRIFGKKADAWHAFLATDPRSWDHKLAATLAADVGTAVHEMVRAHLAHEPYEADARLTQEQIALANRGFGAFLDWLSMTRIEILAQEEPMVSDNLQVGGTPDAIGYAAGKLCILDWKSGNSLYWEVLPQVAAYRLLWEEQQPGEPILGGAHVIRFAKDTGGYRHQHFTTADLDLGAELFRHELAAHKLRTLVEKRVK